jgi:hypothetical protein
MQCNAPALKACNSSPTMPWWLTTTCAGSTTFSKKKSALYGKRPTRQGVVRTLPSAGTPCDPAYMREEEHHAQPHGILQGIPGAHVIHSCTCNAVAGMTWLSQLNCVVPKLFLLCSWNVCGGRGSWTKSQVLDNQQFSKPDTYHCPAQETTLTPFTYIFELWHDVEGYRSGLQLRQWARLWPHPDQTLQNEKRMT